MRSYLKASLISGVLYTCSALQTSPREGHAGTMLLHHPHEDMDNYVARDKGFREVCCDIGFDVYCDKFFSQRIINKCEGYEAPAVGEFGSEIYSMKSSVFSVYI